MQDTFYMVYGGRCSAPAYKHSSYQSAVTEAERLCGLYGGEVFVLRAQTKIEKPKPFLRIELGDLQLNTDIPF